LRSKILVLIATAAFAQAPVPVRVSLGDVSLNKVSFLIADDAGIYAKNGLEVQQLITPQAAQAVKRNGVEVPARYVGADAGRQSAEIAIGGAAPIILGMISAGRRIDRVILATTDNEIRWKIVAKPGITSLEGLKGKRLGYSGVGTVSHYMALAFLDAIGWKPDRDITLVGGALSIDALKEGRVDAVIADDIVQALAPAAGFHAVVDMRPYHIPLPGSSVVASREWVQNNREAARRFMQATVESIALMKQDRAISSAAMAKWFGILDPGRQREVWAQSADLPRKPYPSAAGIAKMMELYNRPEMARYKPGDFYDDSFLKELDQSGYIDHLYAQPPARK
jgi:NitT/TauT family transport system substrate-binding protein